MHKIEEPGELEKCAASIEELGRKCASTEAVAVDAVNYLYNVLNDGACALIRFFRTMSFGELTPHLQELAEQSLGRQPEARLNTLTLLASRGMLPGWNDRLASKAHHVIPLTSSRMVESAPMIAQLIKRFGLDVSQVISPNPTLFLNPKEKNYNVMYVPEALGDPVIVAQKNFVEPHDIRSVIAFGGLLPTGDMFAVLMFMRVFISENAARRFGLLASALELAINEIRSGKKSEARILIAETDQGLERLLRLLGKDHKLVTAVTIEDAIASAQRETFDLIICGTQFDHSRMFDLLQAVKKNKLLKPKPFVCFRQTPSSLGDRIEYGVSTAAKVIGANCYLDAAGMSDKDVLAAIQSYLPEAIWMNDFSAN